jgi:ABC-type transport system involved in multi-copper enzyme maturation permease subunit
MELYGFDTKALDEALSVVPKLDMWSFINAFLSDEFKWILSSICVCSLMASEFTAGTIRNAVSRGFSRGKIYFSKFIIALIQVFAVTAAYVGSGAVTALFFAKDPVTVKAGDIALAVGTYVILLVATASVFLMLCIIFRRSGMSVAAAIAAPLLMVSVLGIFAMANPDSPVSARLVLMETFATV